MLEVRMLEVRKSVEDRAVVLDPSLPALHGWKAATVASIEVVPVHLQKYAATLEVI
jgi:hypothetical protein